LIETPILFTTRQTAELIKYAANSFLAAKITFINEIADLCEAVDADVQDVAKGIGLDGRIGPKFLHAGPGYGGSCFPKDTLAMVRTAEEAKSDVDRLIDRLDRLWNLLTTFLYQDDTPGTASKVTIQTIAEARKTVRTIAEIRGLLKPAIQIGVGVNVNTGNGSDQAQRKTPGPDEVKAALFKVLRHHPEARDELVVEFARIQARYDAPVIEHAESDD
jgi:hypothetical protein